LRLTQARETLASTHIDGFDSTADLSAQNSRKVAHVVGVLGSSYRIWSRGNDEIVPYASYRNTFKPAAQDFGPDYRPDILEPESAVSYELGVKGGFLDGRLKYSLESFLLDFKNLVVTTTDADGNPLVQNAGAERLKGTELELQASVARDLTVSAAVSYHDSRFRHYIADEGGANVNAQGKVLPLSPHVLASFGIVSSPAKGGNFSLVGRRVGPRFLDIANTAHASGYSTVDFSAGYRWMSNDLRLIVENMSDKRPPVSASEFGDGSYYLLPGRRISVRYLLSL
jgi:iron complex outermembrane recepter protein